MNQYLAEATRLAFAPATYRRRMADHERSSTRLATIAGRVLKKGWASPAEAMQLAASVLTQAQDKPAPVARKGR